MELKFRKLNANEIDVRIGRVIKTDKFSGCSLLLYKDARVDMNILDEAVGAMNWQRKHSRDNANCEIGIYDSDKQQWVWKEDTGTESNTESEKGLASDSFKRAGVNWGIGRELYSESLKNIMVACELVESKKDVWKVKNGIDWKVKEIGYTDNEVSKLVIIQTTYGKDETVVYSFGCDLKTGKENQDNKNSPFEQKEENKMTLEEARQMGISANGKKYFVATMTDEQLLAMKDYTKKPRLAEACSMELAERAKVRVENENHD